ncbi:hypothetical protein PanWU01x14_326500, partial [Parasponia andersonii]
IPRRLTGAMEDAFHAPPRCLGRHLPRCLISTLVSKYQSAYKALWKMLFTAPWWTFYGAL